MSPGSLAPTTLQRGGRTLRLKWHQVRRSLADPPFSRANLAEGLKAGASLEVDIRPLACGRFVCLHDAVLENETTGSGPVARADAEGVGRLRMREGGEPLLLLEELVEIVRTSPKGNGARVQLDLCVRNHEIEAAAEASFTAALAGVADRFLLGAYDWDAVVRLAANVTGLALGYDPSDVVIEDGADPLALVRDRAAEADTIYLHRSIVRESHESGDGLVARLQGLGHQIDCWTIDHGRTGADRVLDVAIAAGCDQITTNTARAWVEAPTAAASAC